MLLYLVRHGEPDYATDSLTERGKAEAALVAERLVKSGVDELHSSPMGRAKQTAQATADKTGLPICEEPWAYELGKESRTTFPDGVEKGVVKVPPEHFQQARFRRMDSDDALSQVPGIADGGYPTRYRMLAEGFDGMMERLGYCRNASGTYDARQPNDRRAALFCHGGMMRILLSHSMNIPIHLLAASMFGHFTGVTILGFRCDRSPVTPILLSYGDVGHLYRNDEAPVHYYLKIPF